MCTHALVLNLWTQTRSRHWHVGCCARLQPWCPAPVMGLSWFPQFWLRLPNVPQCSLDLCALASLAGDPAAILKTYNFTAAWSPSITAMSASCTFPYISDNIPSLSHQLPLPLEHSEPTKSTIEQLPSLLPIWADQFPRPRCNVS